MFKVHSERQIFQALYCGKFIFERMKWPEKYLFAFRFDGEIRRRWIELNNIFFFIFLKPSKLVLFDKNCIFDHFAKNNWLPKYFSTYFHSPKFVFEKRTDKPSIRYTWVYDSNWHVMRFDRVNLKNMIFFLIFFQV